MEAVLQRKGVQHGFCANGTQGSPISFLSPQRGTVPDWCLISSLEVSGQHRAFDSMHKHSVESVRAKSLRLQREFPNSSREVNTASFLNRATIPGGWHTAAPVTATRRRELAQIPCDLHTLRVRNSLTFSVSSRVRMPTHGLERPHSQSLARLLDAEESFAQSDILTFAMECLQGTQIPRTLTHILPE